ERVSGNEADARGLVDGVKKSLVLKANARRLFRTPGLCLTLGSLEWNPLIGRTMEQGAALGRRQLLERRVQRQAQVSGQRLGKADKGLVRRQLRPAGQRASAQRKPGVADQQGWTG